MEIESKFTTCWPVVGSRAPSGNSPSRSAVTSMLILHLRRGTPGRCGSKLDGE